MRNMLETVTREMNFILELLWLSLIKGPLVILILWFFINMIINTDHVATEMVYMAHSGSIAPELMMDIISIWFLSSHVILGLLVVRRYLLRDKRSGAFQDSSSGTDARLQKV